jgi:hypothetical protein
MYAIHRSESVALPQHGDIAYCAITSGWKGLFVMMLLHSDDDDDEDDSESDDGSESDDDGSGSGSGSGCSVA